MSVYKSVVFDGQERSKILTVNSPINIKRGMDLRRWVEPFDVGIDRMEFAMTYFADYHELCVSGDSEKLEAVLNTMPYSHAYLTASLLKFLASRMTDQERRVRLQKIIRTI